MADLAEDLGREHLSDPGGGVQCGAGRGEPLFDLPLDGFDGLIEPSHFGNGISNELCSHGMIASLHARDQLEVLSFLEDSERTLVARAQHRHEGVHTTKLAGATPDKAFTLVREQFQVLVGAIFGRR